MDNKIIILRGPDRVRKRPAVIFGSDDAAGVMTALEMLLHPLAKDSRGKITVTQYGDDSIEILSNGAGQFLADSGSGEDIPWETLFCQLYACSAYETSTEAEAVQFDLCAVQYASRYMDVRVVRNAQAQLLHFEKGENVGGLTKVPCSENIGVCFRFQPDPEVFTEVSLPGEQIALKLQAIAIQIPGIKAAFRRETADGFAETVFQYPQGISDYLQSLDGSAASPVYTAELTGQGQERYNKPQYTAEVKLGLRFVKDAGFVQCIHNLQELPRCGSHCDTALTQIARYLGWVIGREISKEALLRHLQLVIVTCASVTQWVNGARTGIDNTLIRDLTQDTLKDDFHHFLSREKASLLNLFGE